MLAESAVDELQTLYTERQFHRLIVRFESLERDAALEGIDGAVARQLAGQAYSRIGNFASSASAFLAAAAAHAVNASPQASLCMRNAFAALQKLSCHVAAEWVALASLSLPRECDADLQLLRHAFAAAIKRLDMGGAVTLLASASLYRATRTAALETLLDIAVRPSAYGTADVPQEPHPLHDSETLPRLSVIVCSRDDVRFARFVGECERTLTGSNFEIVRIRDARSMCEGYNRGTDQSTGDLLVYCHDDIEFFSDGVHDSLVEALTDFDLVSCVGSSVVDSPTWMCHDATFSQGWMVAPGTSSGQYLVGVVGVPNVESPLSSGDGCFLACRRSVAKSLRWDDVTFDAFHLYDIDFCLRARQQGYRLGVARGIAINHHSLGSFDALWQEHARRFLRKHGLSAGSQPANLWASTQVGSRTEANRVMRNMMAWVPINFQQRLSSTMMETLAAAAREFPGLIGFSSLVTRAALRD